MQAHVNGRAHSTDESNTLPGPVAVPGASWCDVCRILVYVGTQGFDAHTQGKCHKSNVELMSTGASPGAIPIPEGFARCDVCQKTFKRSKRNLHLKSQQHLNQQKYVGIDKTLGDASDDGDIIIHPTDGHDFGVVERADDQSLFASSVARFTIHLDACAPASLRSCPKVSLIEVKLSSSQSLQTDMFSSFLVEIEGDSRWIEPDTSLRVMVTLIPSYEGRFEDSLLFVFHNFSSKTDLTISRPVSGIAGSLIDQKRLRVPETPHRSRRPPRPNPSNFVPLKPPTWTRTQYENLLPEFPLPSTFAETLHSSKFDKEIKHAAQAPMPVELNVDTYRDYFETLLWLEEAYIRCALCLYFGDSYSDLSSKIDFAHEDELNLPDIKVGDYLILDQLSTDTCYEVRIHSGGYLFMEDGFVGPLVLRVPKGFSTYRGFKFGLRFVLNRMPLRRMHLAVSAPFKFGPARVLFPTLTPTPTTPAYDVGEIEFYNLSIGQDEEQTRTICSILYLPPGSVPFILYGPPGSGKTATITEAILQLLKRRSSCRILACCPSNSAADELTTRLSTHLSTGDMFRLNAFSRPLQDCREPVVPYTLSNDHDTFAFPPKSAMVKFRIVVSTCSSAGVLQSLGIPTGYYSHVFIDEAGQAEEPLTLIPIAAVAGHDTNIILAGDPKQLGPVVKSHNVGLRRSFLERLMSQKIYDPAVGDGRTIVQLKNNRRSHEAIFTFSNQRFYDNQQQCAGDPKITHSLLGSSVLVNKAFPVVFHGIQGRDRYGNSRSFYNIEEISLVKKYCRDLVGDRERRVEAAEIGVISPYRMQVRAIRRSLKEENLGDVTVGSVEQFQGQERRVIIFSTVRSNTKTTERKSAGFIGDPRRLNVALTRAQALLIVIGDPAVLGKIPLWRGFLNFVHMRGGHTGKNFDWDSATDEPDATELVDHVRTRIMK
ncbi:hypothetical protein HETIRDRAFT_390120 [Heterobasidion irregulare TC 32-1]|uniref:Uncharacterized protein n=1 Tax=Heterobasidion irregulare (strain TC 32-1) TaxID=747525 RepID=W4JRQ3_HETIT|nr:uncharacterized protein HETIRDRAFT_390120 [Heterobasidion irregulare TC 32-1]ETW75760.1 hypothetical protein HETIRDRAFT_390120 [Heterobasidion irregulare TC 32-1]